MPAKTSKTARLLDPFRHLLVTALSIACVLAVSPIAQASTFDTTEAAYKATYDATPIDLTGLVVDEAGLPIASAHVTAIGWGSSAANDGKTAAANASGVFTLTSLARRSVLLRVEAAGYYTEIVPTDLHRPLAEDVTGTGAVVLSIRRAGRARIIVAGDTMLGRRFIDSDGDGIQGEPGDLIRPATRASDAAALFKFMRDVLSSADYTQVNLESQVTANPVTKHIYKAFTFFSYPEALSALPGAGIDGVNLGNNHMYDYLEGGLQDTLQNVPNAGLDWFGAGMDETAAKNTVLHRTIGGGVDVAFQGFSYLVNDGTTLPAYTLIATNGPPLTKGGSL
jgi:hypothetical protein